ncbi:MAG: GAF domain-containing protein [Magnetococcales bacterium]|nr:GAF domain-containing protein [Magnetococcales bacterium]
MEATQIQPGGDEEAGLDEIRKILVRTMSDVASMMEADRSTVFLHDERENVLWSAIMQGQEVHQIRIPADRGIAGFVWSHQEKVNIPDAYQDARFNQEVDKASGYRTRSILCDLVRTMEGRPIGVVQVLNKLGASEGKRAGDAKFDHHDAMLLSLLGQQIGTVIENVKLRQELSKNHRNLQMAFREVEKDKDRLATSIRGERFKRWMTWGSVLPVVALVGAYFYASLDRHEGTEAPLKVEARATDEPKTVTPVVESIREPMLLVSKLMPLEIINHVSPMAGRIQERLFQYGQKVEQGASLIKISTAEEEGRLREAQTAFYQAQEAFNRLRDLQKSPDYTQAVWRRNQARTALERSQRQLLMTRKLFGDGIISRVEMENEEEATKQAEFNYKSSEDAVVGIQEQASTHRIAAARAQLENAERALKETQKRIDQAWVKARTSGIILKPVTNAGGSGQGQPEVEPGAVIGEGGALFAIADVDRYALQLQVDEIDLLRLAPGQRVNVTGDAFPDFVLQGFVQRIASQSTSMSAQSDGSGDVSGPATFSVRAILADIPEEAKKFLRPGMSARAEIIIHENPTALLVPIQAVTTDLLTRTTTVELYTPETKTREKRSVKVRANDGGRVEIVSGIQPTDRLVVP